MQDWQAAYTAQAADFTDQLNTELLRIRTQMKYTLTRSVTLRADPYSAAGQLSRRCMIPSSV